MKKALLVVLTLFGNSAAVYAEDDYSQIAADIASSTKAIQEAAASSAVNTQIVRDADRIVAQQKDAANKLSRQVLESVNRDNTQRQIQKVFANLPEKQRLQLTAVSTQTAPKVQRNGMLFVSMSMPTPSLMSALQVAADHDIPVSFIGLIKGTKQVPDTIMVLKKLAKKAKLTTEPEVLLNPVDFVKYGINVVPTLIKDDGAGHFHRLEGSINADYFYDAINLEEADGKYVNQRVGPTWQIEEKNLIDEMKDRFAAIDWEAKKREAVQRFWQHQKFTDLPAAVKDEKWMIDPTVKVLKDMKDKSGAVIYRAGDVINPLEKAPLPLRMIIINPVSQPEIEFVKRYRKEHPFQGQTILMGTNFTRDKGWDVMQNVSTALNGRVQLMPKEVAARFQLSGTPAVIETKGKVFGVQQFAVTGITQ